jgi:hypothetical protein
MVLLSRMSPPAALDERPTLFLRRFLSDDVIMVLEDVGTLASIGLVIKGMLVSLQHMTPRLAAVFTGIGCAGHCVALADLLGGDRLRVLMGIRGRWPKRAVDFLFPLVCTLTYGLSEPNPVSDTFDSQWDITSGGGGWSTALAPVLVQAVRAVLQLPSTVRGLRFETLRFGLFIAVIWRLSMLSRKQKEQLGIGDGLPRTLKSAIIKWIADHVLPSLGVAL